MVPPRSPLVPGPPRRYPAARSGNRHRPDRDRPVTGRVLTRHHPFEGGVAVARCGAGGNNWESFLTKYLDRAPSRRDSVRHLP
nr:hypothetical protein KPHV_77790 [Kitasatospora purpeofusca]